MKINDVIIILLKKRPEISRLKMLPLFDLRKVEKTLQNYLVDIFSL